MNDTRQAGSEPRYGWVMVAIAAVFMGVGSGSLGAIAVFLKPLGAEFGWLRGDTAGAYLVGSIAMGAGGIAMGYVSDRYSARRAVLFGAACLGVAHLLLGRQASLWQFYGLYMMLGGLGASSFDAPLLANVGGWFERNKGLALGVATAGRSLGQGLMPFTAAFLITAFGWRDAYLVLGLAVLAVLLPLALMVRTPPSFAAGPVQGGSAPAWRPPVAVAPTTFVTWLGVAAIFCCVCMATAMVHVAPLAQDRGFDAATASALLLVIFAAGFFGRIAFGRLADHIGGLRAYVSASVAQTLTVFWFSQAYSLPALVLLAVGFGFGFSGVMTCVVICVREYVPPARRGLAQGTVLFLAWIGMGVGGWQGGVLYDLTGGYTLSFAIAAAAGAVNLALLAALALHLGRALPLARPALEVV